MARFNREALLIDKANDKVFITTFTNRICSLEFLFSVYKNGQKMMIEMLYKATKYMNAEASMKAQGGKKKKRER